jgi:chaperonin cofactor prefoldin
LVTLLLYRSVGCPLMNRTLAEHIQNLEQQRNLLSARVMDERDRAKCNDLETQLRAVESALTLYRSAFEVESRVNMLAQSRLSADGNQLP